MFPIPTRHDTAAKPPLGATTHTESQQDQGEKANKIRAIDAGYYDGKGKAGAIRVRHERQSLINGLDEQRQQTPTLHSGGRVTQSQFKPFGGSRRFHI
jgi:hypothetical protein